MLPPSVDVVPATEKGAKTAMLRVRMASVLLRDLNLMRVP